MHKVQMHTDAMYGLCAYKEDNPLDEARGLSFRTDVQTIQ